MGDDWDEEVAEATAPSAALEVASADLPEIKLFGKWSCDEVNVSDMSLQVNQYVILHCSSISRLK
jgi:small subunit ribosomal protein S5e